MEPHKVDWVGNFLFSYWNLKRKRPEEIKIVDKLVLEFFQKSRPLMVLGADLESISWAEVLCDLMCQLHVQFGSQRSDPYAAQFPAWLQFDLRSSYPGKSRPFVNWVGVEACTQTLDECGDTSLAMEQLLEHMTSVHELQGINSPKLTASEFWSGNLHLKAFELKHGIQPWSVPVCSPVKGPRQLSWFVHDLKVICNTLEGPTICRISVDFELSAHSKGSVRLELYHQAPFEACLLGLFKLLHTVMLRWAIDARLPKRDLSSLMGRLLNEKERGYHALDSPGWHLMIMEDWWRALQDFSLDPITLLDTSVTPKVR